MMKLVNVLVACMGALLPCHGADLVVTQVAAVVSENMDRFEGTPQTLPTGFEVCRDGETPEWDTDEFNGIHPGGTREGACLAWDLGEGDRALGYQPTTDEFTPGCFRLSVSNATDKLIRRIKVAYDVVILNNASRSTSITLQAGKAGENKERIPGTECVSDAEVTANDPAWQRIARKGIHSFSSPVAPGGRIILEWCCDDAGGSGSRDEIGIDNVRISLHPAKGTIITIQ